MVGVVVCVWITDVEVVVVCGWLPKVMEEEEREEEGGEWLFGLLGGERRQRGRGPGGMEVGYA